MGPHLCTGFPETPSFEALTPDNESCALHIWAVVFYFICPCPSLCVHDQVFNVYDI